MHYKTHKSKTLGPRSAHLVATLYEQNKPIFRLKEIQHILNLDNIASSNFVEKLIDRGIAMRLKPGLFILIPQELGKESEYTGNPLIIGREIMNDMNYFISYASAMQVHEMLTQPQLIIYITTLTARRPIKMHGLEFRFIHSQKKYFFGLIDIWITKQERVTVSDLEKTIIDCLKQPEYCGGITEIAKGLWIRHQDIKVSRLITYALKMKMGSVIRRLGFLLELYHIGTIKEQEMLRKHLTDSYIRLDPLLPWEGNFLRKWRLQINVSQEELLSVVRT